MPKMPSFRWLAVLWLGVALVVQQSNANTFIWDPSSPGTIDTWKRPYPSFSNPPVCVSIPANLTLCYGIKYTQMRIPNLLHHDSLNEVIQQSDSWNQLINLKCHTDTQLFLCSLFTPICLDQTIPPCRSLCVDVQTSCEPVMLKHGYGWPAMMRCDQFPVDNNMCIQSQSDRHSPPFGPSSEKNWPTNHNFGGQQQTSDPTSPSSGESSQDDGKFYRRFLDLICQSDWVIKSGVGNLRKQVRIKKYKVIFGNLTLSAPFTVPVNESSDAILDSNPNSKRKAKFVIVGVGNGRDAPLATRMIVNWSSHTAQIKKAIKKVKSSNVCSRKARPSETERAKRKQRRNRKAHSSRAQAPH